eukprot:Hpha_TRINITY_DN22990_c0_g1::TRINITY_DN22990_c0_g1_i1::g.154047::m.154047
MRGRRSPPPTRVWAGCSITVVVLLVLFYHIRFPSHSGAPAARVVKPSKFGAGAGGIAGAPVVSEGGGLIYANGTVVNPDNEEAWVVGPITWFTVLNGPRYFWCEMLASSWHNGVTMNIWGWGNKEFNDWLMTWMKIPLSKSFADGMPEDAFVGFVDGADSLFQLRSEEMLTAYHSLTAGDTKPFVMSTEINCAVQSLPEHGCGNPVFPMTAHGRRHLNSGLWMGRAGFLKEFYGHLERVVLPRYRQGTVQRNDQSIAGKAYHDGWRVNVSLDAESKLFQSVRKAEGHYCQEGQDDKLPPVPDPTRHRLKNCLTDGVPGVFHFNGYAKPFLKKWIDKFWWYDQAIDPRAAVFVNKKPVSLRSLCPKLRYKS